MKETERIQGKALKRIFKLPVSIAFTEILMEKGMNCRTKNTIYDTDVV